MHLTEFHGAHRPSSDLAERPLPPPAWSLERCGVRHRHRGPLPGVPRLARGRNHRGVRPAAGLPFGGGRHHPLLGEPRRSPSPATTVCCWWTCWDTAGRPSPGDGTRWTGTWPRCTRCSTGGLHGDQDVTAPLEGVPRLVADRPAWDLRIIHGADHHPMLYDPKGCRSLISNSTQRGVAVASGRP